jgi:galactokinase
MPSGWSVVILDTGVRHELAAGEYAQRRASCERAARAMGVPSLRHAHANDLRAPGLTPEDQARARHVIGEIARTRAGAAALGRGDAFLFGSLMVQSHASLRDDYAVSCPELDAAVESLMEAPGVVGARMTGGGFGGAAIGLVRSDLAQVAAGEAEAGYSRRTGRAGPARVVAPSGGGSVLRG